MQSGRVPPVGATSGAGAILVPNRVFLETAAGEEWGRVQVAMFAGDPAGAPASVWAGAAAASMLRSPHAELNTYFCVSLQSGGRRGIAGFERLFAIVLDDVDCSDTEAPRGPAASGTTKLHLAAAEELLGPPSYILETSPGNCQVGWFCDLTQPEWTTGAMAAIYTHLGAGDNLKNLVGYMRLPVGTNGKKTLAAPFRHRLHLWQPERRLGAFDWIDIDKRLGGITPGRVPAGSLAEPLPRPTEEEMAADPVLQALLALGRVQGSRGGSGLIHNTTMGWGVDIDCPWIEEHTARAREGTSYVPVLGRFHCFHGHCQDRGPAELREKLGAMLAEAGLPSLAAREFGPMEGVAGSGIFPGELATGTPAPAVAPALGIPSDIQDLARYPVHEFGILDAFEDRHWRDFKYDVRRNQWFRWAGDHWKPDEANWVRSAIEDLIRDFIRAHVDLTQGRVNTLTRMPTLANIEKGAQHRRRLNTAGDQWDADPFLAGVPGGEIDLKTGQIRQPDPRHMISRQLTVCPRDGPTPLWDAFLAEATGGDAEMIRFLQAWAGYNLTGDTSEEVFSFLWGTGGNGKGTFIGVLAAIMGRYATAAPADMFMRRRYDAHPEEVARLSEVRAVMVSEIPGGRTFNTARLKDFTGRDMLTGRYMRENTFEFMPRFKLTIVGNDQPRLPETGEAIGRRLVLTPFTRRPAVVDPELKGKLAGEYEGIAHWMVQGELARRKAGGLQALIPTVARNATREYLAAQDDLRGWAEERCVVDIAGVVPVAQAFEDYRLWCSDQGIMHSVLSVKSFSDRCLELFQCRRDRIQNVMSLRGIKLLGDTYGQYVEEDEQK